MSLYDELKEPFSLLCNSETQIMIFDGTFNENAQNKFHIWIKDQTAFDYLRENDVIQRQRTLEKYVVVDKYKMGWTEFNGSASYIELIPYTNETINIDTKENKSYIQFEDLDGIFICPRCQKRVDDIEHEVCGEYESIEPEYCPYCGQHLDFEKSVGYGVKESHT